MVTTPNDYQRTINAVRKSLTNNKIKDYKMKTDIQKLMETAGVPMDSPKVKALIEGADKQALYDAILSFILDDMNRVEAKSSDDYLNVVDVSGLNLPEHLASQVDEYDEGYMYEVLVPKAIEQYFSDNA